TNSYSTPDRSLGITSHFGNSCFSETTFELGFKRKATVTGINFFSLLPSTCHLLSQKKRNSGRYQFLLPITINLPFSDTKEKKQWPVSVSSPYYHQPAICCHKRKETVAGISFFSLLPSTCHLLSQKKRNSGRYQFLLPITINLPFAVTKEKKQFGGISFFSLLPSILPFAVTQKKTVSVSVSSPYTHQLTFAVTKKRNMAGISFFSLLPSTCHLLPTKERNMAGISFSPYHQPAICCHKS
ncbi:hypothetical protein AVEN_106547-1, partial [Araneus ventricosus]